MLEMSSQTQQIAAGVIGAQLVTKMVGGKDALGGGSGNAGKGDGGDGKAEENTPEAQNAVPPAIAKQGRNFSA
jgi:hypothetical protein